MQNGTLYVFLCARVSFIKPLSCPTTARAKNGYTLIELLVVLVILGLLTGLVTPRLLTLYQRTQMAYQRDDVLLQLSHLNYAAWQQGRKFVLHTYPDSQLPLNLPQGWTLAAKQPIIYYPNGACSGGQVIARYAEQTQVLQLEAPFCRAGH